MTGVPPQEGRLLACVDAAKYMGVPYTTLRDLVFKKLIPVVKIGRAWYFDRRDLDAFVTKNKQVGVA